MTVRNLEEAHQVATEERFLREDDVANHAFRTVSAYQAVMGGSGGIDNFTFSNLRETGYLFLQIEYAIEVASSGLTNDERTCHGERPSVDSGWSGGRAFSEGVLRTLPDFDFKANEELGDGKVLGVSDPDAT